MSSTFEQNSVENFSEFVYSRGANPTRASVEKLAANLEGAKYALAFSTGMAATSCVFDLFQSGDKVLINNNVYGGTWRFVSNIFERRGIQYEVVEDFNNYDFENSSENVRAVFFETPSNPLLEVTDIKKVSAAAKEKGLLVIVDNTFMTSFFQKPLELGADIVVYSATKYYAGHSDILAGLAVFNDDELFEKLSFIRNTTGGVLSPFDSFLLERGIKTLGLRLERHEKNALAVYDYLEKHDGALKIFYPKSSEIQKKQAKGFGGVLSFLFNKDAYDMNIFLSSLKIFGLAVSLGGVESLICTPASMTHESYSEELREKLGIKENLLRLSVGVEDFEDLIEDLQQAFEKAKK